MRFGRDQARAVLLAALMLTSVVAGVTAIGGVAATETSASSSTTLQEESSGDELQVPRDEVYVGETVTLGFPEEHEGDSYEWEVVDGPDTNDDQLLHTSTEEIRSNPDGVPGHNGRVTSFRPSTGPDGNNDTYEIRVTVDGSQSYTTNITVEEREILNGQSRHELAQRYAPVLQFHKDEEFYPTRYEAYIENSRLIDGSSDTELLADATLLDIAENHQNNENLYLSPQDYPGGDYAPYQNDSVYPRTVYTSVHENVNIRQSDETYTAVGYWMTYVNDPKPSDSPVQTEIAEHTGDQEPVFILFDQQGNPQWIVAQQHKGGELREWEKVDRENGRPVLYVGEGSHPTFFGPYAGDGNQDTVDSEPDYLYQSQYFFNDEPLVDNGTTDVFGPAIGYTDPISVGGQTTWKHRTETEQSIGNTCATGETCSYELAFLSGDESWADYEGGVYRFQSDPVSDIKSSRSSVPQQLPRWDSLSDWINFRTYPETEQIDAEIDDPTVEVLGSVTTLTTSDNVDGTTGFTVEISNKGPQPDYFVLRGEGTKDGDAVPIEHTEYLNTPTATERITAKATGSVPIRYILPNKNSRKEVFVPFPAPEEGEWEIDLKLVAYDDTLSSEPIFEREEFTLKVDDDAPSPDVEFTGTPSSTLEPGDKAESTVRVELPSTASSSETFFIGYSAQGPDGEFYDNDGTTGRTVTLDPGEQTTVDLSLEVEEGISGGSYDLVTAVWLESNPDNLRTQLARDSTDEPIVIPPRPSVENIRIEEVNDDTIVVNATATNVGATAERQSLALSFPGMDDASGIQLRDTNFEGSQDPSDVIYGPGETVGSEYGQNTTELEYPLVELSTTDWSTGETKYVTLELPAEQAGDIAYAKSVASADNQRMWTFDPGVDGTNRVDQQKEFVYAFQLVDEARRGDQDVGFNITDVDGQAGGIAGPRPISVEADITANGDPYPADVSGEMFDIQVGGKSVETVVLVTRNRPGEYTLRFVPPSQTSPGAYDLDIEFVDQRFSVELTDDDSQADAVRYSEGKTTQVAGSLQIDRSGSMRGIMDEARTGARAFVTEASEDDYISLVSYSSNSRTDYELRQMTSSNEDDLRTEIDGLSPGGSTNIGDAVSDGFVTLEDGPDGAEKAGIHMTDGRRNTGPSESKILNEIVPRYNRNDICLYTIGFGSGADEQFMRDVAEAADCGSYRFAAESGEAGEAESTLQEVFADIASDVADDSLVYEESGTVIDTVQRRFRLDDSVAEASLSIQFSGAEPTGAASLQGPVHYGGSPGPYTSSSVYHSGGPPAMSTTTTDGDLQVTLYDPQGNEVDPESDPDVERTVVGDTVTYQIDDPDSGEWSYAIESTHDEEVDYDAEVAAAARTTMDVSTDADTYYAGGQTDLTATVLGPDGPIEGATVRADVEGPSSTRTVTFAETSPGVYTAAVPVENASEEYTATVTATKGDVSRTGSTTWAVEPDPSISVEQSRTPTVEPGENETFDVVVTRESGGTEESVTVDVTALTTAGGTAAIPDSAVDLETQVVDLGSGGSETVEVAVTVPEDATAAGYEGLVQVFREDGSAVTGGARVTVPRQATDSEFEITAFEATADGETITVSFNSNENPVELSGGVRGPDSEEVATLDRSDFSGDRFEGFEATYQAPTDGEYTVELTEARDSANKGATDNYVERVTVETDADDANATETPTVRTESPTPGGETTPTGDKTSSPTNDADPAADEVVTTGTADSTPSDTAATTPEETDGDGTGFGSGLALAALLGATLLLYRRRNRPE